MYCLTCKKAIPDTATFCAYCGEKVLRPQTKSDTQRSSIRRVAIVGGLFWILFTLLVNGRKLIQMATSYFENTSPIETITLTPKNATPTRSQTPIAIEKTFPSTEIHPTDIPTTIPIPTAASVPSDTFSVFAEKTWQNTGHYVQVGDSVEIMYLSGQWTIWEGTIPYHDGTGDPRGYICAWALPASQCAEPVPDAAQGSLIARIGTSEAMYIGNYQTFTAKKSGDLQLATNFDPAAPLEKRVGMSAGSIVVQISIRPNPQPSHSGSSDAIVYDDFNNPIFDGGYNDTLWFRSGEDFFQIYQNDGVMVLKNVSSSRTGGSDLNLYKPEWRTLQRLKIFEAKLMISSDHKGDSAFVRIQITSDVQGGRWLTHCKLGITTVGQEPFFQCAVYSYQDNEYTYDYTGRVIPARHDTWHKAKIEINPDTVALSYYFDDRLIGSYTPSDSDSLISSNFKACIGVWNNGNNTYVTRYVDDVRITP